MYCFKEYLDIHVTGKLVRESICTVLLKKLRRSWSCYHEDGGVTGRWVNSGDTAMIHTQRMLSVWGQGLKMEKVAI